VSGACGANHQRVKLVVVTAGLTVPSSTRLLADRLTSAVTAQVAADVTVVELRDLAVDIANHLVAGFPSPTLAAALAAVGDADGVIATTPIFSASYSGLFKSFFDLFEELPKPVLIAATGGTPRHSLALEHALRPLFTYLHAIVAPTSVYAASADWADPDLAHRIARAAGELAELMDRHPAVTQPAETVIPFEQQLAALRQKP